MTKQESVYKSKIDHNIVTDPAEISKELNKYFIETTKKVTET